VDKSIVTYSRSVSIVLTKICGSSKNYYHSSFKEDAKSTGIVDLLVPYSVITICKAAKKKGVKEATLICGERPASFAAVRAKLDAWGFSSFIEYIYTVAELCFLEGIIPCIDAGYLTKEEISIIRRMSTSIIVKLENVDSKIMEKLYHTPTKETINSKLEVIKNAAEGKVPVTISILVGVGETQKSRKETLELIKRAHERFNNIQNVVIRKFIPLPGTPMENKKSPDKKMMISAIEQARKILPEDIIVTVEYTENMGAPSSYINAGARDFGSFDYQEEKENGHNYNKLIEEVTTKIQKSGRKFQHRLPIFSKYIIDNWYSRKLAQVLDKYRVVLKVSEKAE